MNPDEDAIKRAQEQAIEIEPDRGTLLDELAALPRIDYDKQRKEIARKLGCRPTSLDAEVEERRSKQGKGEVLNRGLLANWSLEPSAEPVDGAGLLDALSTVFTGYLVLPQAAVVALALWTLHAWAHDASDTSPLLVACSPEKRCGKTRLFRVLSRLVPRPLFASNITGATLFRAIEKYGPTLLIDEGDTFLRDSDELRGLVNSGHDRDGAFVWRTVGDDHEPKVFSTWAPKALALIGRLPDTIEDRAIIIPMRRKRSNEKVPRLGHDDRFDSLRCQAARWTKDHVLALRVADPELPDGLEDRPADHWRPLIAIADEAGGNWPRKSREAATRLSGHSATEDGSPGTMLLADMREIFGQVGDRISSADAVERLAALEHRPWPEWKSGRPITVRQLATMLKGFGVEPRTIRIGGDTPKGYVLRDFEDAFECYVPVQSATPPQTAPEAGVGGSQSATPSEHVADEKSREPLGDKGCGGVADRSDRNATEKEIFEV